MRNPKRTGAGARPLVWRNPVAWRNPEIADAGVAVSALAPMLYRRRDPHDLLDSGVAGGHLVRTRKPQRMHALLHRLSADRIEAGRFADKVLHGFAHQQDFINTLATVVAGIAALQTALRVVTGFWRHRFPRRHQLRPRRRIHRTRLLAMGAECAYQPLRHDAEYRRLQ